MDILLLDTDRERALIAARIIVSAAYKEGKYSLLTKPLIQKKIVKILCRITNKLDELNKRCLIKDVDFLILDPKLIKKENIQGLRNLGFIVANSKKKEQNLSKKLALGKLQKTFTYDCSDFEDIEVGVVMTAALSAYTNAITLNSLLNTINDGHPLKSSNFYKIISQKTFKAIRK